LALPKVETLHDLDYLVATFSMMGGTGVILDPTDPRTALAGYRQVHGTVSRIIAAVERAHGEPEQDSPRPPFLSGLKFTSGRQAGRPATPEA
jgi:hypothetical protein